jgi:hypothetical protein
MAAVYQVRRGGCRFTLAVKGDISRSHHWLQPCQHGCHGAPATEQTEETVEQSGAEKRSTNGEDEQTFLALLVSVAPFLCAYRFLRDLR